MGLIKKTVSFIKRFLKFIIFLLILFTAIGGWEIYDHFFAKKQPPSVVSEDVAPEEIREAKVQSTMESACSTKNEFEDSIWGKKGSFKIVSRNADTGEPEFYGAREEAPYQSQMIYPFGCPLPFIATISVISKGKESIGLQFEYDGVFQAILGDGDRRAVRYKRDTEGTRKYGWEYIKSGGKTITHWLDDIKLGSQIDFTISAKPHEEEIEVICSINYYSETKNRYEPIQLEPIIFKVDSFNPKSDTGRYIRVGINDEKFKGKQAAIKFLHFSLKQE